MLVVKQNKNFAIVLKFSDFTEFALKSKEFAQIVSQEMPSLSDENYEEVAEKICKEVSTLTKEKAGRASTLLIKTEKSFNTYFHTYPHGKDFSYICEKAIIMGSDSVWGRMDCINAAMLIMGEPYSAWKNKSYKLVESAGFSDLSLKEKRALRVSSALRVKAASKAVSKKIAFCVVC